MAQSDVLVFSKRPSSFGTLYHVFRNGKHRIRKVRPIHPLHALWEGITVTPETLARFCTLCGIPNRENAPFLFPLSLIYPLMLRMISSRNVPVPMLRMLTIRKAMTQYRDLKAGDLLSLSGDITGQRFAGNGMEMDFHARLYSKTGSVFDSVSTLYIPNFKDEKKPSCEPPRLEPIFDAAVAAQWFLPAGKGLRFAKIMGDSNGIHYSKTFARMLGFKRDFAQPAMVTSQCLERLPGLAGKEPLHLDLFFKGPVYYESNLTMRSKTVETSQRFDLYCEGNNRPCISGKLSRIF